MRCQTLGALPAKAGEPRTPLPLNVRALMTSLPLAIPSSHQDPLITLGASGPCPDCPLHPWPLTPWMLLQGLQGHTSSGRHFSPHCPTEGMCFPLPESPPGRLKHTCRHTNDLQVSSLTVNFFAVRGAGHHPAQCLVQKTCAEDVTTMNK